MDAKLKSLLLLGAGGTSVATAFIASAFGMGRDWIPVALALPFCLVCGLAFGSSQWARLALPVFAMNVVVLNAFRLAPTEPLNLAALALTAVLNVWLLLRRRVDAGQGT